MLVYQKVTLVNPNWRFFFLKNEVTPWDLKNSCFPRRMDASWEVGSTTSGVEVHLWMPMLLTTPIFVSQFAVSWLRWGFSERSCSVKTTWEGWLWVMKSWIRKNGTKLLGTDFGGGFPWGWFVSHGRLCWVLATLRWVSFQLRKLRLLEPHPLPGSLSLISVLEGEQDPHVLMFIPVGVRLQEDCRKVLENEMRANCGTPWDDIS